MKMKFLNILRHSMSGMVEYFMMNCFLLAELFYVKFQNFSHTNSCTVNYLNTNTYFLQIAFSF